MQEKNSAILFDLDGTLLNSGLTFHKIVNQLKKEINQEEVPFEKVRKYSSLEIIPLPHQGLDGNFVTAIFIILY